MEKRLEQTPVFRPGDLIGLRAQDGNTRARQGHGQIERRLSAQLNDDASGFLHGDDMQNILKRQRLEVELVGRVVIRADGFRIRVDHDAFHALLAQSLRSVDAAVVEFDALADAVGAPAEDDETLGRSAKGRPRHSAVVGGIVVGRIALRTRPAQVSTSR